MPKVGELISSSLAQMAPGDQVSKRLRALEVRDKFRQVMEGVYGDQAPLFLAHVNNVYILREEGGKRLVVYVDAGIFAAELNAQRELIKLRFLDTAHEALDAFDIHVSRGGYKDRHPYAVPATRRKEPRQSQGRAPLSASQERAVEEAVSGVRNPQLARALKEALTSSLRRD